MRFRNIGAILAAALALTLSGGAYAADDAEELIKQALDLRRRGDDLGALPLCDPPGTSTPTPPAPPQLGFCAQALGRWADAEVRLSEALKAANDPWVKKNRVPIEESLATTKTHVAVIEISGEPAGGEVLVNGNLVGTLPLAAPLRVGAGEIDLELRARGYQRATRNLRVDGGQYQKVVLRAQPEVAATMPPPAGSSIVAIAPPPASSGATPPDPTATSSSTTTTPPTVTAQPASPVPGWRRAAKWVSWGVGAAALGVGFYGASQWKPGRRFQLWLCDRSADRPLRGHGIGAHERRLREPQERLRIGVHDEHDRLRRRRDLRRGGRRAVADRARRRESNGVVLCPGARAA